MLSYLNTLDVAPPFESMLNPFCCRGFLRVVHHHKRLNVFMQDFYFPLARRYVTNTAASFESHDLHDVSFVVVGLVE